MITKEQIIDIAKEELTPIGWHEEQAKYIDGLDAFAERLVKLCKISHVSNSEERAKVCEIDGCDLRPYGDLKVCKHHFLEQIDKQT